MLWVWVKEKGKCCDDEEELCWVVGTVKAKRPVGVVQGWDGTGHWQWDPFVLENYEIATNIS